MGSPQGSSYACVTPYLLCNVPSTDAYVKHHLRKYRDCFLVLVTKYGPATWKGGVLRCVTLVGALHSQGMKPLLVT